MATATADRNLLFGVLALQMDFVSRDALIAAMHAWALDKATPLGQILCQQGALAEAERILLGELVDRHLARHGHDPEQSLAALRPTPEVCAQLAHASGSELLSALSPTPEGPATVSAGPAAPLPADGRYQRLRPHAKGGLGEVWVAADRELEREVALKEIQAQHAGQADSRARFLLEARVTGGLEHPGIVPVYGLGHHPDGRPFYAMRLVKGDSLRRAIEQFHAADWTGRLGAKALAFRQLLGRFIDVCDAVEYAHSRGVLHRDLKPGNVMLGKYGETLVVDWGLAKVTGTAEATEGGLASGSGDSGLTQAGKALGTPAYMSPEQAAGKLDQLGPASDVYSLGATLYTLLTNQAPFLQGEMGAVLARVERGEFAPPRQVNRQVPRALEAVCLKAMARDPQRRYTSPRALAGDLEHWLADEPVSAYREPLGGRARRYMKRYRAVVLGAVAVLGVAAVSLAVATVLLSAKNEELLRANANEQAAKEQAQANFALAVQAVEDYLTGVADNDRLKEKDLEPLRRDLMRSAQAYYRRFAEQERNSPPYRSLAAQADISLGRIHDQLGEWDEAKARFGQAAAALRELAKAEPAEVKHRQRLFQATLEMADLTLRQKDFAATEVWAGNAFRLNEQMRQEFPKARWALEDASGTHRVRGRLSQGRGRMTEAEQEFLQAVRLQEQVVQEDAPPAAKLTLIKTYNLLGILYRNYLNRPAAADEVYRKALALFDRLDGESKRQPAVLIELASCQRGLARALALAGRLREAEEGYRAAVRTGERLAADFPMIPSCRECLAEALNPFSSYLGDQGANAEYLQVSARWVEVTERMTRDFPHIHAYRMELARASYGLGRAKQRAGDKEGSVRLRRQSVALMTALVNEYPTVPAYRQDLGLYLNGSGAALAALGRHDEARAEYAKAVEATRPMAEAHPEVPDYQSDYAQTLVNYGGALTRVGQVDDALRHLQTAVAVLENRTGATYNIDYRALLGLVYTNLADVQRARHQPQEARLAVERAIATLEEVRLRDARFVEARRYLANAHRVRALLLAGLDLEDPEVKDGQRALSLAHVGKYNEAFKEARALAAQDDLSAEGCYTLARVSALLSQARKKDDAKGREGDADRALALLRRAHAAGYFKDAARVERLRREPDLTPLRDRPEFQELAVGGK
jgi:serine/threonine-protein kinase